MEAFADIAGSLFLLWRYRLLEEEVTPGLATLAITKEVAAPINEESKRRSASCRCCGSSCCY